MPRTSVLALCVSAAVFLAVSAAARKTNRPASNPPAETPKAAVPSDPYIAEVTKFRQDREATLKGNAGWLTIAGLWFLTQPQTTFGSDPLNDIVFPASAPPRAGTFDVRDGKVTVTAAEGVTFQLDGKPRDDDAELKSDVPGPADRLMLGNDLQFWVHNSGDRLSIRLRDQNSSLRKDFAGLSWFPIDPAYRVEATYTPFDKPKIVDVASLVGDSDKTPIPGLVKFTLKGQEYALEPFAGPGRPAVLVRVARSDESERDLSRRAFSLRAGARERQDDSRLQQDRQSSVRVQPVHDMPAAHRAESVCERASKRGR